MSLALRQLLAGAIDYAGVFPPATLPLEEAVDEYAAFRGSSASWIVSRFVVPAPRVGELMELIKPLNPEEPWDLAVIASGPDRVRDDIAILNQIDLNLAICGAYEIKASLLDEAWLERLKEVPVPDIFVEIPWGDVMSEDVGRVQEAGLLPKARTGGLTPSAIPSVEELALFMVDCRNLDTAFKLTAGLHHPFRHDDPEVGARFHGFVNVIMAGALQDQHDLSVDETIEVLGDDNPGAFRFDDETAAWGDLMIDLEQIDEYRLLFAGFGSCSIAEPLDDLRRHGLLEEGALR